MEEKNLQVMLDSRKKEIKKIAPKYINIDRMLALAVQAVQKNPLLKQCSGASVLDFCMKCAEAGTDRIGAGGMWAVPFYNNKTKTFEMTAIPDWRLIVEKARKAKVIKYANAEVVYRDDVFVVEKGLNPNLIHKPALKSRKQEDIVAAYCIFVLPDDTKDFVVMTREEIDKIKERSKAQSETSPWNTDYAEMAKKTVVKRALKIFEGASLEMSKVMEIDNEAIGYGEPIDVEPIAEPQPIPEQQTSENLTAENIFDKVYNCEKCGKSVSEKVMEFSKEKFGKTLCRDCQKTEGKN